MIRQRENPLLFERSGAFNPGWLFYMIYATIGVGACCLAMVVAYRNPAAWPLVIAALSFVAFGMLSTAIMVISLARAKLIAPALKEAVTGIAAAAGDFQPHEWAKGDPKAGVM